MTITQYDYKQMQLYSLSAGCDKAIHMLSILSYGLRIRNKGLENATTYTGFLIKAESRKSWNFISFFPGIKKSLIFEMDHFCCMDLWNLKSVNRWKQISANKPRIKTWTALFLYFGLVV